MGFSVWTGVAAKRVQPGSGIQPITERGAQKSGSSECGEPTRDHASHKRLSRQARGAPERRSVQVAGMREAVVRQTQARPGGGGHIPEQRHARPSLLQILWVQMSLLLAAGHLPATTPDRL